MKLHARNVAWLLPLILTGCAEKARLAQAPPFAPPVSTVDKPTVVHPELSEGSITLELEAVDTDTDAIVEEAAKPAVRRHRAPARPAPEVAENSPPASVSGPPAGDASSEVPAMGDLSSVDPADDRLETANSITETERGLKSLGRPLNAQEQKTASQIRQFIRQAKKALNSGDAEGARTLAAKAKVLLGELNE